MNNRRRWWTNEYFIYFHETRRSTHLLIPSHTYSYSLILRVFSPPLLTAQCLTLSLYLSRYFFFFRWCCKRVCLHIKNLLLIAFRFLCHRARIFVCILCKQKPKIHHSYLCDPLYVYVCVSLDSLNNSVRANHQYMICWPV